MKRFSKRFAIALTALLAAFPLTAAFNAEADDRAEPTRKAQVARTPMVTLKERETVSIVVTRLTRSRIDLVVTADFFDEAGLRIRTQRGVLDADKPTFVAALNHDDLDRLDPALIRSVVRTATVQPTGEAARCPIGTTLDTSSGNVLTWTGDPCDCGPTTGGHVFLTCPPPGTIGTNRD